MGPATFDALLGVRVPLALWFHMGRARRRNHLRPVARCRTRDCPTSSGRSGVSRRATDVALDTGAARHDEIIRCRRHATHISQERCSAHRLRGLHHIWTIPPRGEDTAIFGSRSEKPRCWPICRALPRPALPPSSSGGRTLAGANPQRGRVRRPPCHCNAKPANCPSDPTEPESRIELRCISRGSSPLYMRRSVDIG